MEQLVALGISWVWMGLEGEHSQYTKLHDIDAFALVRELQSHGIRVLGSTIIGLENHTAENIDEVIDYAVRLPHRLPPIHALHAHPRHAAACRAVGPAAHEGRKRISRRATSTGNSSSITATRTSHGEEGEMILRAFQRDFEVNGPSVTRIVRTTLAGWNRYQHHPDLRIRRRFAGEVQGLGASFSALLGAARRYYRHNPPLRAEMSALLARTPPRVRLASRGCIRPSAGPMCWWKLRREQRRLSEVGPTSRPPSTKPMLPEPPDRARAAQRPHDAPTCRPAPHEFRPAEEAPVESEGAPVESLEPVAVSDVALTNRGSWRCWLRRRGNEGPSACPARPRSAQVPCPR